MYAICTCGAVFTKLIYPKQTFDRQNGTLIA
jgi:hypothetical protein